MSFWLSILKKGILFAGITFFLGCCYGLYEGITEKECLKEKIFSNSKAIGRFSATKFMTTLRDNPDLEEEYENGKFNIYGEVLYVSGNKIRLQTERDIEPVNTQVRGKEEDQIRSLEKRTVELECMYVEGGHYTPAQFSRCRVVRVLEESSQPTKQKQRAKQKRLARKKQPTEQRQRTEQKGLAKQRQRTEQKGLAKQRQRTEQKGLAKQRQRTEQKGLAKQRQRTEQKGLAKQRQRAKPLKSTYEISELLKIRAKGTRLFSDKFEGKSFFIEGIVLSCQVLPQGGGRKKAEASFVPYPSVIAELKLVEDCSVIRSDDRYRYDKTRIRAFCKCKGVTSSDLIKFVCDPVSIIR